jgi:hypothetical protein
MGRLGGCFIGPLNQPIEHRLRLKIEILPAWLFDCLPLTGLSL